MSSARRDPQKEKTAADSSKYNFDPDTDHGKKIMAAVKEVDALLRKHEMKDFSKGNDQILIFIYELHSHYRVDGSNAKDDDAEAVDRKEENNARVLSHYCPVNWSRY